MPRHDLELDKDKAPEPGTYFCTNCNRKQEIRFHGQKLKPCPKCGGKNFATV